MKEQGKKEEIEKCLMIYILMNDKYKDWQFKAIKEILI